MSETIRSAEIIHGLSNQGEVVDYKTHDLWPNTIDEAYEVQKHLEQLRDEPVIGWKIAATAIAGRKHINVDRPLAGRLFQTACHSDAVSLSMAHNRMAVAEAEFVFTLGSDLAPKQQPYTTDEVAACIGALHPGLEFPDSRFADFTIPGTTGLIADNACAWQFVLGEASAQAFDPYELASHQAVLYVNDVEVTRGVGSDALDGPLNALVWIANTLSELGVGLKAGQFVTTGVIGQPFPIKAGDHVRVDLGVHGSVCATLTV